MLTPTTEDELREAVAGALARGTPVEILGAGSKAPLGRHVPRGERISLSALTGISLYEPDELVLTAGAGTGLAEIETALAGNNQQLAFEPPDWSALLGADGNATIGGVIACNLSGPRRLRAGAARDHFLGVRAVSGRGEVFKSGGRVVKNVTGYDMCKLLAGSYGTLAAMAEITLKVLPAAERLRTLLAFGLDDRAGIALLTEALQSPNEVSAAAHLPADIARGSAVGYVRDSGASVTAIRVEGHGPSVDARLAVLGELFAGRGAVEELHRHNSVTLWREIGNVTPFSGDDGIAVWRLSVPPATGAEIPRAVAERTDARAFYDWGGGLIWLAVPQGEDAAQGAVRAALGSHGGHATLIRASEDVRARVPVFHPQEPALAALSARIKQNFDPHGILNPGRMYEGV